MEEYILLQGEQIGQYVHMVPDWLLMDFGKDHTQFWGMEEEGVPYGVAVLQEEEQVVTLQYLYLEEPYRKVGRGQRFLTQLLLNAYHEGQHAFQAHYLPGEYPEMERLLRSYPFLQEEESLGSVICTLEELSENKYIQGTYGNHIRALSECTEEGIRSFCQILEERGVGLVDLPINKADYVAECSAVLMEKGNPVGMLLVKEEKTGEITIPFLINFSSNVTAPIEMIRFAVQMGKNKYPKSTVCKFAIISESLLQFIEKIGIHSVKRRCVGILELSYFTKFEKDVESYLDDEFYNI